MHTHTPIASRRTTKLTRLLLLRPRLELFLMLLFGILIIFGSTLEMLSPFESLRLFSCFLILILFCRRCRLARFFEALVPVGDVGFDSLAAEETTVH